MAGATGYRYTFATRHRDGSDTQQTHENAPLFERIGSDDFAELQVSAIFVTFIRFSQMFFCFFII